MNTPIDTVIILRMTIPYGYVFEKTEAEKEQERADREAELRAAFGDDFEEMQALSEAFEKSEDLMSGSDYLHPDLKV